jgi:hypothetical protein
LSLLAGFTVTVAVSWGLSLWQDVSYQNNAMRMRGVRARKRIDAAVEVAAVVLALVEWSESKL